MPIDLPLIPSEPNQGFSATLEETQYVFECRWHSRDASWYLSIFTEQEDPIRVGMRVVLGAALGRRSPDDRMPPGAIVAVDTSAPEGTDGLDATLDDLGTRVQVRYYTRDELAEG
jgi:hypothetical protein